MPNTANKALHAILPAPVIPNEKGTSMIDIQQSVFRQGLARLIVVAQRQVEGNHQQLSHKGVKPCGIFIARVLDNLLYLAGRQKQVPPVKKHHGKQHRHPHNLPPLPHLGHQPAKAYLQHKRPYQKQPEHINTLQNPYQAFPGLR